MSFKSIAQSKTRTGNNPSFPDIDGFLQFKVDDIIRKYPDGITVTAFGCWTKKDGSTLWPVLFDEEPYGFLWAGKVLQDILAEWLSGYNGDAVACSADLKAEGGVKIKFRKGKTKNGRDITYVDIV